MRHRVQRMNILGANLDVRGMKKTQGGPREQMQGMGMMDTFDGSGRRTRGVEQSTAVGNDSGYE